MITVKLDKLAKRLNKNISQIAKETGINRNTITALYHNKVDGIKFPTLEKICEVYGVKLADLLEYQTKQPQTSEQKAERSIYKQEGEAVLLSIMLPAMEVNNLAPEFFPQGFEIGYVYSVKEYGYFYWDKDIMDKIAKHVYDNYSDEAEYHRFYSSYLNWADKIEDLYNRRDKSRLLNMGNKDLMTYYRNLREVCAKFWSYGLFIDCFDPGYDGKKIGEVAKAENLTAREISILTNPPEMNFSNQRLLVLLHIIKKFKKGKVKISDKAFSEFLKTSPEIAKYKKDFNYYQSNYSRINPIDDLQIISEMEKYLSHSSSLDTKIEELENYDIDQETQIQQVLAKHKLKTNPLNFFSLLTYWREHRKAVNLMSINILFDILEVVSARVGISMEHLKYLMPGELENASNGLIDHQVLKTRSDGGVMVEFFKDGSYKLYVDQEARSLKNELDKRREAKFDTKIINGQVASQGYAKGVARIILSQDEFANFKEGEILVTSMTRPEFVPVMKKAKAIVTNEGGITCHAAIVSRELGKPCIIGTQVATKLIHDGDLVEVRANHGTVRILEKVKNK